MSGSGHVTQTACAFNATLFGMLGRGPMYFQVQACTVDIRHDPP